MLASTIIDISVLIMASVRWYNASAHYAFFLAEGLRNAGVNVEFFGIKNSPLIERAKRAGYSVIDEIDLMSYNPFSFASNMLSFRKIVKNKEFDIIHPHISRDHTFAFFFAFRQ